MSELNRANRNLALAHEEYIRNDDIADCAEGILDAAEFYKQQLTTITAQRDELLKMRIKPRKEKRWIAVCKGECAPRNFETIDSAKFWIDKNASMNSDYWQFIEIEMEV